MATARHLIELKIKELEGNNAEFRENIISPDGISSHNSMYRNSIRFNQEKIDMLKAILENSEG
jgi:hypothetical protein